MTDLEAIGKACFALHARMTARLLSRVYDAAMRPADLRLAQFGLLGAIAHGTTASETALAERLGLERTTLVRNLKLLEEKGWIEPVAGDGRGVRHRLTEAGREKFESAIPLWEAAQRRIEDSSARSSPTTPALPCGRCARRAAEPMATPALTLQLLAWIAARPPDLWRDDGGLAHHLPAADDLGRRRQRRPRLRRPRRFHAGRPRPRDGQRAGAARRKPRACFVSVPH
jgi:DNA-binding MarR family transcriptional regulator